jgi:hypothetical protein
LPEVAAIWKRAVPAFTAAAGNRTSSRAVCFDENALSIRVERTVSPLGQANSLSYDGVRRSYSDIDRHVLISLILDDDGKIDLVAEVHEPRSTRPYHQWLFRGDRRFSAPESFARID